MPTCLISGRGFSASGSPPSSSALWSAPSSGNENAFMSKWHKTVFLYRPANFILQFQCSVWKGNIKRQQPSLLRWHTMGRSIAEVLLPYTCEWLLLRTNSKRTVSQINCTRAGRVIKWWRYRKQLDYASSSSFLHHFDFHVFLFFMSLLPFLLSSGHRGQSWSCVLAYMSAFLSSFFHLLREIWRDQILRDYNITRQNI